jgi:hypothetical protein
MAPASIRHPHPLPTPPAELPIPSLYQLPSRCPANLEAQLQMGFFDESKLCPHLTGPRICALCGQMRDAPARLEHILQHQGGKGASSARGLQRFWTVACVVRGSVPMNSHHQADTPLVHDTNQIAGPASINTLDGQLAVMREWVRQYEGYSPWPEVVAARAMTLLVASSIPFHLEEVRADTRRVIEILQAFGGQLACLDAQISGLPEVQAGAVS